MQFERTILCNTPTPLIGRQSKTIVQVNAFHVYDLIDPMRFPPYQGSGRTLCALMDTEIRNMEEYLVSLEIVYPVLFE